MQEVHSVMTYENVYVLRTLNLQCRFCNPSKNNNKEKYQQQSSDVPSYEF